MTDLADLKHFPSSDARSPRSRGGKEALDEELGNLQVRSMRLFAMTCPLALISIIHHLCQEEIKIGKLKEHLDYVGRS